MDLTVLALVLVKKCNPLVDCCVSYPRKMHLKRSEKAAKYKGSSVEKRTQRIKLTSQHIKLTSKRAKPHTNGTPTDIRHLPFPAYIFPIFPFWYLWYFWLAIQNTANRHVSNAFDLLGVFISFPLARAAAAAAVAADFRCCCCWAPLPHLAPFYFGGGKYQKK